MSDKKYPIAYACYNNNIKIRLQSTSGGTFTLIAQYVIKNLHGIVCGAAYNDVFKVHHICIETMEEIDKLRGSKYPQSSIGNCYKQVKTFLDQERIVLFVGTPCQVQGLYMFLNKNYDNLWCVDFVCHGVASKKIWFDYIKILERKGEIEKIVFKDKRKGWKKWYFKVTYHNHSWYQRGCMNQFMKSFLEYANIRPSCFECRFKGLSRNSDFTISDCWGIGEQDKELNDNKGLSALLIQNERAKEMFNIICKDLVYKEYNSKALMSGNWTMFQSVKSNKNRADFFRTCMEENTEYALKKFFTPTVGEWLKYYIMCMLGKEK